MTMKIEINLSNVITSKDQVKPGMHLWNVGQGGVTGVCEPRYAGQVIGFGSPDYTFAEGARRATGFIIKDPYADNVEFVALATLLQSESEMVDFTIPEGGYQRHIDYPIDDLRPEDLCADIYVTTNSYLPAPYNNWYMCDSLEKAQAVYEEMKANWSNLHEQERKKHSERMNELERIYDSMYYPDEAMA